MTKGRFEILNKRFKSSSVLGKIGIVVSLAPMLLISIIVIAYYDVRIFYAEL